MGFTLEVPGDVAAARAPNGPSRHPGPGTLSTPGRSLKIPSGLNLSIRMIRSPMRICRIDGPNSGRDAGDGRNRVSSTKPI